MVSKGVPESDCCGIFSDLSNPTRLEILNHLQERQVRTAVLAKTIGVTIQAIQRHVDILAESGLVLRNADGSLSLSAVGVASLDQIPLFEFLSKHRKYFQDHTFSGIPRRLVQRLGDLNSCEFIEDQMHAWQRAKTFVENSSKYLYGITSVQPIEFYVTAKNLLKKGIIHKIVHAENMVVAKGFEQKRRENGWIDAMKTGQVKEQFVRNTPFMVGISEKEAQLMFASKKTDQIDGTAIFHSTDHTFRAWCMELFNCYWDEVEKVSPPKLQEI